MKEFLGPAPSGFDKIKGGDGSFKNRGALDIDTNMESSVGVWLRFYISITGFLSSGDGPGRDGPGSFSVCELATEPNAGVQREDEIYPAQTDFSSEKTVEVVRGHAQR